MRHAFRQHPLLPGYTARSGPPAAVAGWLLYAALIIAVLAFFPPGLPRPKPTTTLLFFGALGAWRWSWGALHMIRALVYKHVVFPRIRRRAEAAPKPPALYVLVTSYRMTQTVNAAVYGKLFDEIARYGVPTFVVACVTDQADVATIGERFVRRTLPEGSRLRFIAQRGRGKRDTMAAALKAMAAVGPPAGAQVVLMDGDTVLGEGALARSCAVLAAEPHVGALTTDNRPLVEGSAFTREWYRARMAHRDNLMASLALSRKLLVLTGRFSIFRAELATSNRFIQAVETDTVDHARLGRIPMLTGDDKSTWFEVLRSGWDMLYVPDVAIYALEKLPPGSFLRASTALMLRWYGNMVRNNGRALRLGPRRCGTFTWISLFDQRLSMWTALTGPTVALVLALTRHPSFLVGYLLWVLLSRGVLCVFYWLVTGRFHPLFFIMIYYNQVVGALIKIYAYYHPDLQQWTRQVQVKGTAKPRPSFVASLSTPFMLTTGGGFVLAIAIMTGTLEIGARKINPPGLAAAVFAPVRPLPILHGPGGS